MVTGVELVAHPLQSIPRPIVALRYHAINPPEPSRYSLLPTATRQLYTSTIHAIYICVAGCSLPRRMVHC
eukprot:365738-Chlamydomonas_euryale.AAC.11